MLSSNGSPISYAVFTVFNPCRHLTAVNPVTCMLIDEAASRQSKSLHIALAGGRAPTTPARAVVPLSFGKRGDGHLRLARGV
jgi:hypothetical protein